MQLTPLLSTVFVAGAIAAALFAVWRLQARRAVRARQPQRRRPAASAFEPRFFRRHRLSA